jgi:hypothetical protein
VALPGHSPARWEAALLECLPYAKRLDVERREPAARQASLAGIALALVLIERLAQRRVRAGELQFDSSGKPWVPGGPFFSISHTAGRVACAASLDLDCGLDVEAQDARSVLDLRSIDRLRRWTATEAALKSAGLGLRDAKSVQLSADGSTALVQGVRHHLVELSLAPGIFGHLAAPGPIDDVKVEEVPRVPGEPPP